MLHSKKLLSSILALSIIASTALTSTAFAATNAKFKSDTNSNFSVVKGNIYTFKLTPANPKEVINFSTGNAKALQVVSNEKRANGSYYATVKAIGDIGSSTGVYASVKGDKVGTQLCVIKIASADQIDPSKPTKTGPFGIVIADDERAWTDVGVYNPSSVSYSKGSMDDHLSNLRRRIKTCKIINGGFSKTGSGSDAYVRVISDDNGHFGLRIDGWRSSKSKGDPGILNGVLSAMVYFSGSQDAGISLWAWVDDTYTKGSVDSSDYGFKDMSSTDDGWQMKYKGSGKTINVEVSNGAIELLFID